MFFGGPCCRHFTKDARPRILLHCFHRKNSLSLIAGLTSFGVGRLHSACSHKVIKHIEEANLVHERDWPEKSDRILGTIPAENLVDDDICFLPHLLLRDNACLCEIQCFPAGILDRAEPKHALS